MPSTECIDRFGANVMKLDVAWKQFGDRTYVCRVVLCPEIGGGFSAHAARLPGVVSQGETEAEALDNIAGAFQAAIQCYLEIGQQIPWSDDSTDWPAGSLDRLVVVDV